MRRLELGDGQVVEVRGDGLALSNPSESGQKTEAESALHADSPQFFPWAQISQVRYDAENMRLEVSFHPYTLRAPVSWPLVAPPAPRTLEQIRAGVEGSQFYAAVVRLPSGRDEHVQILRDANHDLRLSVGDNNLQNPLDQHYLSSLRESWREKLGVEVLPAPELD